MNGHEYRDKTIALVAWSRDRIVLRMLCVLIVIVILLLFGGSKGWLASLR